MVADEPADVVGRLDVDVERHVDRRADRRDLRQGQVGRQVDRRRAEAVRARGRPPRSPRAASPRPSPASRRGSRPAARASPKTVEHTEVGDQHRAEAVLGGAQAILEIRDEPAPGRAPRRRSPACARAVAESPHAAFGRANSDTSTVRRAAMRASSSSSRVRLHEDARALRDAVHAHVERAPPARAPPRGSAVPRSTGSRRDTGRRPGIASCESGRSCRSSAGSPVERRKSRTVMSRSYDVGCGDGLSPELARPVRGGGRRSSASRSSCAPTSATG